jgi:transcriptional regulator with XRE-family HTH domain
VGYRGKLEERARARELRAEAWTLREIADELGVAKSSVSTWVRDVAFDPSSRRSAVTHRRPRGIDHPLRRRKLAQLEQLRVEGLERIGSLSDREFLVAGLGLYAGDGAKGDMAVRFANSNPELIAFFCRWLRRFFEVEEDRLRLVLYLHEGLDLDGARLHWPEVTGIPQTQFGRPYRAAADATIRHNKHEHGCAHVGYSCSRTQRTILALGQALLVADGALGGDGSGGGTRTHKPFG